MSFKIGKIFERIEEKLEGKMERYNLFLGWKILGIWLGVLFKVFII